MANPSPAALERLVLSAKGLRGFGDGYAAILIAQYLLALGYGPAEAGLLTTATLFGSALMTIFVGVITHRTGVRALLLGLSTLMLATGLAFAVYSQLWPLVIVGFIGTLNPSGGDVSAFVPLEHSLLAQAGPDSERTARFARYSIVAALTPALGVLLAGVPSMLSSDANTQINAMRGLFVLYGVLGIGVRVLYRRLPRTPAPEQRAQAPLTVSRGRVFALAGLFAMDSFAGGFVAQSLMALWLSQHLNLSVSEIGWFYLASGVLSACSFLAASALSKRIGLVNTMVFTHIPSSLCLIAAALTSNVPLAIALLLVRAALSQMDVPTRSSYVMAIVTPEERAAAASVTAAPRSLASAASPALAGHLMALGAWNWPLLFCGSLKIVYDVLLLAMFSAVKPPEEARAAK